MLSTVRENPGTIILDPKRDIRSFRVARTVAMGARSGRGRASFIDSMLDLIDSFYADVVQHLKPWTAAPPKMREVEVVTDVDPALVSTAQSSQDGPDEFGGLDSETPQSDVPEVDREPDLPSEAELPLD